MPIRSLKEIREAIPPELFIRDTRRAVMYLMRDLLMAALAWSFALRIDPFFSGAPTRTALTDFGADIFRYCAWAV
jgi:omega-6 fatty acid desaturase (delta-12 desaturase)